MGLTDSTAARKWTLGAVESFCLPCWQVISRSMKKSSQFFSKKFKVVFHKGNFFNSKLLALFSFNSKLLFKLWKGKFSFEYLNCISSFLFLYCFEWRWSLANEVNLLLKTWKSLSFLELHRIFLAFPFRGPLEPFDWTLFLCNCAS